MATNSICQGQQVPILWPLIFQTRCEIAFAHTSFKWSNLASHNAGVTVVIVGISPHTGKVRRLFVPAKNGQTILKEADRINAYLVAGVNLWVEKVAQPLAALSEMSFGNKPVDGGHLLLTRQEVEPLGLTPAQHQKFIRRIYGSAEFIRGLCRYCLWIEDDDLEEAQTIEPIRQRIERVRKMRLANRDKGANEAIRFTSLTPPGKSAHTFTYTAVAQVATYTPPAVTGIADPSTRYQYDRDQQLTRITRPDGGTLDYTYDTAGRLNTLRIPTNQTYRYPYNAQGKLSQIVAPGNITLTYTDDEALPKQVAWSGSVTGSVNDSYDNNLRLDSLTLDTNDVVTYQYNDDSLLIKAGDLTL